MATTPGTAAAAKFFIAVSLAQAPTVSSLPDASAGFVRPIPAKTYQTTRSASNSSVANYEFCDSATRETTPQELLVGELRNWALLDENWDGEGAAKPISASIRDAVSFADLFDASIHMPEPMLLASGRAALFWHDDGLYADLEFLGDNRIAYFIQKNDGKHKGVASFDPEKMPAIFQALLSA